MEKTKQEKRPPLPKEGKLQEEKISNHEDTALKVTAQFFQEEIMLVRR